MIKVPAYLKKGDTIGIVCPSGYMPATKAQTCIKVLKEWGYQVKIGKTLGNQHHYFSGTNEARRADLQAMLDDDSIQAVLCGRGGYGLSRIIDQLDFKKFRKKPKWIIGFSDITVLHAHIYGTLKIASLHAPMAAAFNDKGYLNPYVQSLKQTLQGKKMLYTCPGHVFNRTGKASGDLIGGNLSLVVHLNGTSTQYSTKGKILFLEDLGEYIYHIDRMMIQLKRSGMLKELAGLIIGRFTEIKDTVIPFGSTVYETILEQIKEYNYPVCFDFPVGHDKENYALKHGLVHDLSVGRKKVVLKEIR